MRIVVLIALLVACGGEHRAAREKYNEGVAAIQKGDFEAAAKALVDARSGAGVDPELRFRAAFDLGVANASQADKLRKTPQPDLAKALELAQQALSWFNDAARQRPTDEASKTNVAIMRARVQAISDQLRQAEGKLEARIEAAIKEQRGVLDGVRQAWLAIKKTGGSDPLAQQGTLTHLADLERAIVAEVGAITDLAGEEIDAIGKKAEDKRTDEEKVRVVQLKGLDIYLLEARARIAEARRKLQDLAAEQALGRAEAALVALKRAREQLLDPITVLKSVTQDELELMRDTAVAASSTELVVEADKPREALPAWLEPPVLGERQGGLRDRVEEVRARLAAAVEGPPPEAQDAQAAQRAKLLERVKAALPFVATASGLMDQARQGLSQGHAKPAVQHEREAIAALTRAIEEFADLRTLIELAHAEQEQVAMLLSPEGATLLPSAGERERETTGGVGRNAERLQRMKGLIVEQAAQVEQQAAQAAAKAAQAPAPGAGSGSAAAPDPAKQAEAAKQQLEAAKQQLAKAEELRGQAQAALGQLGKILAAGKGDPVAPAGEARQKIDELRKLFFSVIEHLQQLIRDQGETRDQTSAAHAEDELARAPKLPGLATREEQHEAMAKAITEALAQQADAASKGGGPPPQGQPDAKTLASAADEVRLAQKEMRDASGTLVKARDAKTSSESVQPAIKSQATAIEHLENALRLLQPPKQNQQQQQQQQQHQQQQQQPQQQPSPAGAGQTARDQDATQQKKRHERESSGDPVEKDW